MCMRHCIYERYIKREGNKGKLQAVAKITKQIMPVQVRYISKCGLTISVGHYAMS